MQELYNDSASKLSKGDLPAALKQAEEGLRATQPNDPKLNWDFRLLKAEVLLWQGKSSEVLALVDSEQPLGLISNVVVQTKIIRCRALNSSGNSGESKVCLADAERSAIASSPELLGEVKLAEGGFQYSVDSHAAEQDFLQALQIARKYHQTMLEAKVLGSLSRLATHTNRYDEAVDWGLASLHVANSIGAVHVEAATQLNLGWVYLELGDFQQAIPLFQASEETAAKIGLKSIQQRSLNSLGRVFFNQDKLSEAEDYYRRALAGSRELGNDSDTAVLLNNLALVALDLSKLNEAEKDNYEALAIQRRVGDHAEELRSLLTSAAIYDARKEFDKAKPILSSVIFDKKTPMEVRWEAEDELANLQVAIHRPDVARTQFKKTLDALDALSAPIQEQEHKLAFSLWASKFYTNYIRFLADQRDYAEALRIAELMRARTLRESLDLPKRVELQLPALQNFLERSEQVVLDYWLAPQSSYVWIVTPKVCTLFPLPGSHDIENKIDRYQTSITNLGDVEKSDSDGQELYRILIAPVQKFIPAGARVVIVPDGSLGKLNFETLLAPGFPQHFWIRDVQLAETSSLAMLMRSNRTLRPNPSLLAIGDPVQASPDYPPLLNAKKEIESSIERFPESRRKVVSGAQATPSAYTSNKPWQYDLIHFATHGVASKTRPLDSAIILSAESENSFKLYARDILKIHLNAELVTISACYGAGERTYSGEGLVGLAWAFLYAGAHQVIAGLWKVDDQSTPQLMKDFYAQFHGKASAAEALRAAKLKMLDSHGVFRLPYYWGSLQLYMGS